MDWRSRIAEYSGLIAAPGGPLAFMPRGRARARDLIRRTRANLALQPLRMLGMIVANGQRAAAAGVRISEVLGTAPQIVDVDAPSALPTGGDLGRVVERTETIGGVTATLTYVYDAASRLAESMICWADS